MATPLSIGALARASGLSAHTLRHYEKLGILRPADRAPSGHRRYHADDVAWLEFVLRLKATGMPLAEIRRYADLRAAGSRSLGTRLAMLQEHRRRLRAHMTDLARNLAALDDKIRTYRKMIGAARHARKEHR